MIKIIKASKNLKYVKADAAEDARRAARERRQAAKDRRASKATGSGIISKIKEAEDPIEEAFEQLVPASGKADTVAGEAVRAMMRLLYRDYNDGDRFFEGYGIETCADAVAYLTDIYEDLYSDFEDIAMRNLEEERYTNALKKISDKLLNILYANPELFTKANTEDYQEWDGEQFIKDAEWEPMYDFDVMLPRNVEWHLEMDHISERDLQWELESWEGLGDADIEIQSDIIYVNNIDKDTYDEIEGHMYNWLEDYGDQLDDEFGSEDDYEEEEEDEEEEEEEEEE